MSGDCSSTNVEPVDRLGRQFLCWASLDGVNPTWEIVSISWSGRDRVSAKSIPGIGSFPCLFKKAEYASMNFCAWNHPIESALFRQQRSVRPPRACSIVFEIEGEVRVRFVSRPTRKCVITHINIANGNTTGHDCGRLFEEGLSLKIIVAPEAPRKEIEKIDVWVLARR